MSLVGSLEDLALGDILQIVSLARKSGLLLLRSDAGDGRIVFSDGLVQAAFMKGEPEDLAGVLVASGMADADRVREAVEAADAAGRPREELLAERTGLAPERIDSLRREHVERVVVRMFGWNVGEFSFDVRDAIDERDRELALPSGINAQFLSMEAARIGDERGEREASAAADDFVLSGEVLDEVELEDPPAPEEPGSPSDVVALAAAAGHGPEEDEPFASELGATPIDPSAGRAEGTAELPESSPTSGDPGPEAEPAAIAAAEVEPWSPVALEAESDLEDPSATTARFVDPPLAAGPPGPAGAGELEAPLHEEPPSDPGAPGASVEDPTPVPDPAAVPVEEVPPAPAATASLRDVPPAPDLETSAVEEVPPAPAAAVTPCSDAAAVPLVVIDRDLRALEWIKSVVAPHFLRVHIFQHSEGGIGRIRQYLMRGELPTVLVSVDVPPDSLRESTDPTELLRRLRAQAPRMPILVMHEGEEPGGPGVSAADALVSRPPSAILQDRRRQAEVEQGAAGLLDALVPWSRRDAPLPRLERSAARTSADQASLERLREISDRLRDPATLGDVLTLVMEFAAESFQRVAMFMVRDDEAVGIAQRGLPAAGGPDEARFRQLRIPLGEPACFQEVVASRRPHRLTPDDDGDRQLTGRLGDAHPAEIYVAPIESGGRVAAILYADNLPGGARMHDPAALTVVLHEAGLALDRALLERALAEVESADPAA